MKKWFKSNIFIYFLIVLLPTILSSSYYLHFITQKEEQERTEYAKWIGSIYQRTWDTFIGETMTSLKILSLSSLITEDSKEKIKPLLMKIHQTDPRFGGLYILNPKGKVLEGSNSFLVDTDLSSKEYIQTVIKSKDSIISDYSEMMINNQRVVGLATPVIDDHQHLKAIILANLRIDYIENTMRVLSPEEKIKVISSSNNEMISLNDKSKIKNVKEWISVPIEQLPWTIKVKIAPVNIKAILIDLSKFILSLFIITNILFLLSKYLFLKRQASHERAQNEAQKLELVGSLAASSAHEIRNPLTGIKGLVQLLSEKYKSEEDQYYFSVIQNEIERINEIVSEFLILGKPTAQKLEKLDLRQVIHEIEPLIVSEGNLHQVKCTVSVPLDPIIISCSKDQLKQVILNITRNAFESMDKEGCLSIDITHNGTQCQLVFTDTGIGISKEGLKKIFLPFFTTKDTGTGLGLVVCKRIIQSFDGSIEMESEEGKGTKVTIQIPLSGS
ncbi:ATP-binding protein [Bacillus sp. CGMCC 1.16607]|uniref:ATP-binding protein n=1 Tax=Bacillus sp. CGMCC 1.16607 TaxID=3351842 RepID=UPI0036421E38